MPTLLMPGEVGRLNPQASVGAQEQLVVLNEDNQLVRATKESVSNILPYGVYVFSEADLPTPVGGQITLVSGTLYTFVGTVIITNELVIPAGANIGLQAAFPLLNDVLVYAGVGTLINGVDIGQLLIRDLILTSPTGGTLFDIQGSAGGNAFVGMDLCTVTNWGALGTLSDFNTSGVFIASTLTDIGQGFVLNDINAFTYQQTNITGWKNIPGTIMFNFNSGTFNSVQISNNNLNPNANETVFLFNTAATYGNVQIVANSYPNQAGSVFFDPVGENQASVEFIVKSNANVQDSTVSLYGYFTGNALTTTINTAGVPEKSNAAWSQDATANQRMSFNSNGTFTYVGLESNNLKFNISVTVTPGGAGVVEVGAYIAKNGSVISYTKTTSTTIAASAATVSTNLITPAVNGDFFEIFVSNETSNNDVVVNSARLSIGL